MVHKVLIIGAGFGGNGVIHGLIEAEKNFQDEAGVSSPTSLFAGELEITLLDRKTMLSIGGTWQFMWSSRLSAEQKIEWPLADLQANHFDNVQLISGNDDATVETLDIPEKRVLLSNGKTIEFDTLVLSPGVISDPSGLPGLVPANCDYSDPTKQALDVCNIQHVSLIHRGIDQVLEQAKTSTQTILICVTKVPYKVSGIGLVFPFCFFRTKEYACYLDELSWLSALHYHLK
jgi:NADH dehydrogenase FAD-containing subunit